MDEATAELLSRYLDGDLDAGQARRLEQRLAAEPDLEAELAALRRLQLQVRSVAERMVPPAALEVPFERPDLGAARRTPRVPPAVRWLGLAAGVALAVTVVVEVARRPASLPAPATAARPAQAPAGKAQAVGATATTRLEKAAEADAVASGAPAPSPAEAGLPQPPPPEPKKDLSAAAELQPAAVTGGAGAGPSEPPVDRAAALEEQPAPPRPSESVVAVAAAPKLKRATSDVADEAAALESFAERGAPPEAAPGLRLELVADNGAALVTLALPAGSADIGSRFVVTVAAGVIVAIEPDAAGSALDEVIGQRLTALPDGRYVGVVVGHAAGD